ncbi:hypothetical protein K6025_01550 [Ehrlichia sp. JZT12]
MFSHACAKGKKLFNILEQVRMVCLLVYIIGALLFLLKRYNIIHKNLSVESSWLISISVVLFLILSTFKLIICTVKSENSEEQKLKSIYNASNLGKLANDNKINPILVIRGIGNVVFTCVCIVTGSLLLLRNFSSVQERLLLNIYNIVLLIGISLAGLYFATRFLFAGLGVCNNFIDNLNAKYMKCEATDFVINKINSQISTSLSQVI